MAPNIEEEAHVNDERYREIRKSLRDVAKHPEKIDRLTNAQVEELTVRMALVTIDALAKLRAVAREVHRMTSLPELN
jgi:hypothetical protein